MNDLKIGMFGAGVVGGGVYELIEKYTANQQFANNYGVKLEIVKICVQHMDKERDFKFDRAKLVAAYDDILKDPSINCIVEAIGGIDAAKHIILQAIQAGKHVVTANKALIAACLPEIQAELDRHPNVR
jgi:homoserine dehydrogenase